MYFFYSNPLIPYNKNGRLNGHCVQTQEYGLLNALPPTPLKNRKEINAQIVIFQVISQFHSHMTRLSKINLLGTTVNYSTDSQRKCNGLSLRITK